MGTAGNFAENALIAARSKSMIIFLGEQCDISCIASMTRSYIDCVRLVVRI